MSSNMCFYQKMPTMNRYLTCLFRCMTIFSKHLTENLSGEMNQLLFTAEIIQCLQSSLCLHVKIFSTKYLAVVWFPKGTGLLISLDVIVLYHTSTTNIGQRMCQESKKYISKCISVLRTKDIPISKDVPSSKGYPRHRSMIKLLITMVTSCTLQCSQAACYKLHVTILTSCTLQYNTHKLHVTILTSCTLKYSQAARYNTHKLHVTILTSCMLQYSQAACYNAHKLHVTMRTSCMLQCSQYTRSNAHKLHVTMLTSYTLQYSQVAHYKWSQDARQNADNLLVSMLISYVTNLRIKYANRKFSYIVGES